MPGEWAAMQRRQGVFWLLTIPHHEYVPHPNASCQWLRGQLEQGESGYVHWQIMVALSKKGSLATIKSIFGDQCHAELSRSSAASEYVWKDATRVANTQFEFGCRPICRNSKTDWESVWESAKTGDIQCVPANIRVQSYRTLRSIASDHDKPVGYERECFVFWGKTGTGKSRRAWDEAGIEAYSKDPRTKFWCGYQGEANVVLGKNLN